MRISNSALAPSALWLGILLASIFTCSSALAGDITITPGLQERVTWNDNFFLKEFDDFELRSQPTLSAAYDTERTNLLLLGRLDDFRYADYDQYDRTTYTTQLRANHRLTERLAGGLSGGWSQDYSLDTYWDDDLTRKTMLKRDTYNAAGSISYDLTERDSLQLTFGWATMEYEKRVGNYSDYDMMNANLVWQHLLGDGTVAIVAQGSWQRVEFDSPERRAYDSSLLGFPLGYDLKQDVTQTVYSGTAGIYWMISEKLTTQVMAGATYTESKIENDQSGAFAPEPGKSSDHNYTTGFTGSVDLTWKEDNKTFSLKIGQEFLPSTYGELRKVTSVRTSGIYYFDRKSSLRASVNFNRSKSDSLSYSNKIDRDFWILSLAPTYRFTEDFSTTLQYSYMYYDNRAQDRTTHSNSIYLQFAYALPLHF